MINKIRRRILQLSTLIRNYRKQRIFILSFQRCATTSTGAFFSRNGYDVAGWHENKKGKWTLLWQLGDYEKIFKSIRFRSYSVYEDSPWWHSDFYKVLFHRFPGSRFVLVRRDADQWFDSMVKHSGGKTLGNTERHAKLFHREAEYLELQGRFSFGNSTDRLLKLKEEHRLHYKNIMLSRNKELEDFFEQFGKERLVVIDLEDEEKWKKLADFFGIKGQHSEDIHLNSSKT